MSESCIFPSVLLLYCFLFAWFWRYYATVVPQITVDLGDLDCPKFSCTFFPRGWVGFWRTGRGCILSFSDQWPYSISLCYFSISLLHFHLSVPRSSSDKANKIPYLTPFPGSIVTLCRRTRRGYFPKSISTQESTEREVKMKGEENVSMDEWRYEFVCFFQLLVQVFPSSRSRCDKHETHFVHVC